MRGLWVVFKVGANSASRSRLKRGHCIHKHRIRIIKALLSSPSTEIVPWFRDNRHLWTRSISKMAKWGEGDSRWRVEDLGQQGRNVNSWHWEETNALPWCKTRLTELLCNKQLLDSDGFDVKTEGKVKLTGEATVNQRKGKIIPAYELKLTVRWSGSYQDGSLGTGELNVEYISDENHDEDPAVEVVALTGGPSSERMRDLLLVHGRPWLQKQLAIFVKDLWAGGPRMGGATAAGPPADAAPAAEATPSSAQPATSTAAAANGTKKSAPRTIEITENFYASAKDIYDCFTDAARVKAYTGSPAEIDARPGGKISMFGGSVEGTFRSLEPHSKLEMDWRFNSWPEGAVSKVCITLSEEEKGSVVFNLKQTEIPETDRFGNHDVVGMTSLGWKQQILIRMRQVFGYGA